MVEAAYKLYVNPNGVIDTIIIKPCKICGKALTNLNTGNIYRQLYCKGCAADVKREKNRARQRNFQNKKTKRKEQ